MPVLKIRSLPIALAAVLMLAACGQGPAPLAAVGTGSSLSAQSTSFSEEDELTLTGIVERIAAQEFSETSEPVATKPAKPARGGLIYKALAKSEMLRKSGYFLVDGAVRRHFSKPDKVDKVPPLSAAERADLMKLLQPGDVIQCGNNGSFVHAIFYVGDGQIVHSLAQAGFGKKMIGVRAETLNEYLDRSERDTMVVLRPTWTPEALKTASDYVYAQVGKGYDTLFLTDSDERFYCTELVYSALVRAGVARIAPHDPLKGADWRLVTNEDIRKSADLRVVFKRNHD